VIIIANLLENDIKLSCEKLKLWARRLRDMNMYRGSSSPFDYLVWDGNTLLGLECKIINDKAESKSFPFSRLSDVQREGLLEFDKIDNSKSFILVNFRWINHKKGKLFVLPITEFINFEYSLDRKSISLDMFNELTIDIPRYHKGWNLKLLM
jgi:hypothetical protein